MDTILLFFLQIAFSFAILWSNSAQCKETTRIYRELLKTKMREDDRSAVKLESCQIRSARDLFVQTVGCEGRSKRLTELTFCLEQNAYKF